MQASLTDGLTGLPNHRRFHEDGAALIEACKVSGERFALVICDLDDFKDLNDRRGHVAGDDALRLVAGLLANGLRPDDRGFRLGGEEFGLLLPATTKSNARTVCRRLQRSLANVDLDGWRLTQSMGISSFPEDGETIRDLYAAADAALYEAKRLGKDRITLADEKLLARRTQGLSMAVRGRRSFEQMRHLQALASALAGRAHARARRRGDRGRARERAAVRRLVRVPPGRRRRAAPGRRRGARAPGADGLRRARDRRAALVPRRRRVRGAPGARDGAARRRRRLAALRRAAHRRRPGRRRRAALALRPRRPAPARGHRAPRRPGLREPAAARRALDGDGGGVVRSRAASPPARRSTTCSASRSRRSRSTCAATGRPSGSSRPRRTCGRRSGCRRCSRCRMRAAASRCSCRCTPTAARRP